VGILKPGIEGHPRNRTVGGSADSSVTSQTQNSSPSLIPSVSRWPSWSWGPWFSRWPRWSGWSRLAWPARLPLRALQQGGWWKNVTVVTQCFCLSLKTSGACAAGWSPLVQVGVTHHTTGAQHLIVAGICTHRADEHRDEHHQHQDQHNPHSSRHQGLPPDAESGKGLRCQRGSPGGGNGDCLVWGVCHQGTGPGDPRKSCKRNGECVRVRKRPTYT